MLCERETHCTPAGVSERVPESVSERRIAAIMWKTCGRHVQNLWRTCGRKFISPALARRVNIANDTAPAFVSRFA